jgi:hypothetical protein
VVRSSVAFALVASLLAAPACAEEHDFIGVWKNADARSQGLSQLDVRRDGTGLIVHAVGKCHPTDCGWGQARAHLLASRPGLPLEANADTAFAEYVRGGVRRVIILAFSSGGLTYQTYTIFENASRPSYHDAGRMARR